MSNMSGDCGRIVNLCLKIDGEYGGIYNCVELHNMACGNHSWRPWRRRHGLLDLSLSGAS